MFIYFEPLETKMPISLITHCNGVDQCVVKDCRIMFKRSARSSYQAEAFAQSNQIILIGLRSSNDYCKRPGGVGIWEGSLGCAFLCWSICAEGMCCGRRWVSWLFQGTGTVNGHPGVPWKMVRWLPQPAICSMMVQPEWRRRIGDGVYSIAVGETWMRGRVALGGLDRVWLLGGFWDWRV